MTPEAFAFARKALGLAGSHPLAAAPLGKRGSDRVYFRLTWGVRESAILVHYDPRREENRYHAAIARFLYRVGVPVPRVIGHDPAAIRALIERARQSVVDRQTAWDSRRSANPWLSS